MSWGSRILLGMNSKSLTYELKNYHFGARVSKHYIKTVLGLPKKLMMMMMMLMMILVEVIMVISDHYVGEDKYIIKHDGDNDGCPWRLRLISGIVEGFEVHDMVYFLWCFAVIF